ncbi:MAG TPA: Rpn family recombination-promoting nuclease/putative transposase [Candidatus Babeliales bacterium]|nr:Rpn family recombination-promoting nuclease/putative transposase [Candidatus Babeliales bacterium]
MIFLDPKSDIAFKKLFGDITHKNILMSFLNSVLGRVEGNKIIDVVINDPNNVAETPASKTSAVGVRCTDQDGNQYIVEMQVVDQKDYAPRAQYYSAVALDRQLAARGEYTTLVPVIFVGILDFNLLATTEYISHHFILDAKTFAHELKHLEFHFIELSKFEKELESLFTVLDKWIYFLKHAVTLQKIPSALKDPVMTDAFNVLEQGNWSKKELEAYDRYLDQIRSSASQLETAYDKGIVEGKMKGGLAKALEIAQDLLDVLDVATIARKTGLTVAQLEELKKRK